MAVKSDPDWRQMAKDVLEVFQAATEDENYKLNQQYHEHQIQMALSRVRWALAREEKNEA